LFGSGVFVTIDNLIIHVPFRYFVSRAIASHQLPLWVPYLYMGTPFLANGDAAFLYPFQLPFFLTTPERGLGLVVWLHLGLAAIAMYALCRVSLGLGVAAAATAGIVFGLGGQALGHSGLLVLVYSQPWPPLVLLCLERGVNRNLWWAWAACLPFAFGLLAGQPQQLYLAMVWVPVVLLVLCWGGSVRRLAVRTAVATGTAVVGGFLLTAVQVLPQLELVAQSGRNHGLTYGEATVGSLPKISPWRLLLPDFAKSQGGENFAYIGGVALLLVVVGLIGLIRRRRWPQLALWAGMATISYLLAMGSAIGPLYHLAFAAVPGLDRFRFPVRWLYPASIALCVLVAYGVDDVLGWRRPSGPDRWHAKRAGVVATLASVLATGVAGVYACRAAVESFDRSPLLLRASLQCVAALVIVIGLRALAGANRLVSGALIASLVAAELLVSGAVFEINRPVDPGFYHQALPPLQYVLDHPGGRVFPDAPSAHGWSVTGDRLESDTPLLHPGVHSVLGIGGNWPPENLHELERRTTAQLAHGSPQLYGREELWRALDVRYLMVPTGDPDTVSDPELVRRETYGDLSLYELRTPGRRARALCGARYVADQAAAIDKVLDPAFTADTVILEGAGVSQPTTVCGSAEVSEETLNSVDVEVDLDHAGWLTLADTWYPGWKATVDDHLVPIRRTNAWLRGVALPAGHSHVRFEYGAPAFRKGLAISFVAWCLWLLAGAGLMGVALERRSRDAASRAGRLRRRLGRWRPDPPRSDATSND
jgi:hypothetical protein